MQGALSRSHPFRVYYESTWSRKEACMLITPLVMLLDLGLG